MTARAEAIEARFAEVLAFIDAPRMGTHKRKDDYCYQPCQLGLHVCGMHPNGDDFLTVANLPVETPAKARALFDLAKANLASADDQPRELVIDLQNDFDTVEDFPMSRQMLERLVRLWARGEAA